VQRGTANKEKGKRHRDEKTTRGFAIPRREERSTSEEVREIRTDVWIKSIADQAKKSAHDRDHKKKSQMLKETGAAEKEESAQVLKIAQEPGRRSVMRREISSRTRGKGSRGSTREKEHACLVRRGARGGKAAWEKTREVGKGERPSLHIEKEAQSIRESSFLDQTES